MKLIPINKIENDALRKTMTILAIICLPIVFVVHIFRCIVDFFIRLPGCVKTAWVGKI